MSDEQAGVGPVDGSVRPPAYCGCIDKINDELAPHGAVIRLSSVVRWYENGKSHALGKAPTLKVEGNGPRKGRLPTIYGKFCPFCGVRTVAA